MMNHASWELEGRGGDADREGEEVRIAGMAGMAGMEG